MRVSVHLRVWMITVLLLATSARGQHDEHDLPRHDSLKQDSRLLDTMCKGRLTGRIRQYNLVTVYDGAPQDFHAIAFGGVLGYASVRRKGLQFRMAAGFNFELSSTASQDPDPETGQFTRYEIGLFDVADPTREEDLSYQHEFQLNYNSKSGRHRTAFGEQELNTPILSPFCAIFAPACGSKWMAAPIGFHHLPTPA